MLIRCSPLKCMYLADLSLFAYPAALRPPVTKYHTKILAT